MQLPARVGKYELVEFLGGGMSHVYRAQDTVLGRTVALKMLTEAGCQDDETKKRFILEAKLAGNISHDNVISIFDYGEDNGRPFIVMEFLRGLTLRDAIRQGTTGDIKNQVWIALQIARALDYIHSKKIIHRDVKPENLHIDGSGRVKLMDFGIAKSEGVSLTRVGFTLGTPYYMAPEQIMGQEITTAVDVYAFGVVIYELLCGVKPIRGETVERVFSQILHEPLDLEPLRRAGAPQAIFSLIERCTEKEVRKRIPTFVPVVQELERLYEELTKPAPVVVEVPAAPPTQPVYVPPPPPPMEADPLPAFMLRLPARLQTQEWFIGLVATAVLSGMLLLYFVLRLIGRVLF